MGKPVFAARLPAEPLLQRMGVGVDGLHIPQREGEREGRRAVRQGRERVIIRTVILERVLIKPWPIG